MNKSSLSFEAWALPGLIGLCLALGMPCASAQGKTTQGAGVVWQRLSSGWNRSVIEPDFLTVEAGGAVADIDGDGYPDLVFGGDWQSNEVWWWRNPGPPYRSDERWQRYRIKASGATQQHDQIFGDFKGTGKPQLVFWNQGAKKLLIADIPAAPRHAGEWPTTEVFSGIAGENPGKYAEGLAAADMDSDGRLDLLAGNYWFKYLGNGKFRATRIADIGGRIGAAHLIAGSKYPQVVIAPGDGNGPLRWYECRGKPTDPKAWIGHDLLDRDMIHGHSLQIADIDGDGHLDIFAAEMAKWTESRRDSDNPNAQAWIFYGDGRGRFRRTVFATGIDFHEARVADLNGDGRLDILDKPYNWNAPRVDAWLQERAGRSHTAATPANAEVGLELYSLRQDMGNNVPQTLAQVHSLGFQEVEVPDLYSLSATEMRRDLDTAELRCTSVIFPYERFGADLEGIVRDAKALGASFVVTSWLPHGQSFTPEDAARAAKDLNAWGKTLAAAGLHFCYHTHGYEFMPAGKGETVFDKLVLQTDPKAVNFEMDVFWVVHGGQDPTRLLAKYPHRFPLLHLKDMRKGTPTGVFTGQAPEEDSVTLGMGTLDFPAILREAHHIGVTHSYIEDEAPTAAAQIPQSLRYLHSLATSGFPR